LSDELKRFFVEEYCYQKEPSDGEFYYKIREHQGIRGEADPYFERMWLARLSALSPNRRELLNQLSRHGKYSAAFNALLDVPALLCGFRLTVIHQMMSMKCEEVTYPIMYLQVSLTGLAKSPLPRAYTQILARSM